MPKDIILIIISLFWIVAKYKWWLEMLQISWPSGDWGVGGVNKWKTCRFKNEYLCISQKHRNNLLCVIHNFLLVIYTVMHLIWLLKQHSVAQSKLGYPHKYFSSKRSVQLAKWFALTTGSWGPEFESHWRQTSAHDCVSHCAVSFIITLPSS